MSAPARRGRFFYGWYVLAAAALAMVGTLPGRTQGLGLVTESLLADLGLDRVTYATLNFWATIIGAAGALGVGRLIDRFGARIVVTAVAVSLGIVVSAMSQVTSVAALAVAMTFTRGLGQSALSVVSIAMVGHWFVRRINTAMAMYSLALSIGFMIAFPVVGSLVQSHGWRSTWLAIGITLLAVIAPISWLVVRRSPEAIGAGPDGDDQFAPSTPAPAAELSGHRWSDAVSTGAFWVFALGAALYGLVASGIGLFNESILAERGFGPDVYYQTLVVTAMTALAGNFLGGFLATRMSADASDGDFAVRPRGRSAHAAVPRHARSGHDVGGGDGARRRAGDGAVLQRLAGRLRPASPRPHPRARRRRSPCSPRRLALCCSLGASI